MAKKIPYSITLSEREKQRAAVRTCLKLVFQILCKNQLEDSTHERLNEKQLGKKGEGKVVG